MTEQFDTDAWKQKIHADIADSLRHLEVPKFEFDTEALAESLREIDEDFRARIGAIKAETDAKKAAVQAARHRWEAVKRPHTTFDVIEGTVVWAATYAWLRGRGMNRPLALALSWTFEVARDYHYESPESKQAIKDFFKTMWANR